MNRKAAYFALYRPRVESEHVDFFLFYASGHKLARKEKERECLDNKQWNNRSDNFKNGVESRLY